MNFKLLALPMALSLVFSAGAMDLGSSSNSDALKEEQISFDERLTALEEILAAQGKEKIEEATNGADADARLDKLAEELLQIQDEYDTRAAWVKNFEKDRDAFLDTLKEETKYAAVSALCYGAVYAGLAYYLKTEGQRSPILLLTLGLPASVLVGNKLTNAVHEYMDPQHKHKKAQFNGFVLANGLTALALVKLAAAKK